MADAYQDMLSRYYVLGADRVPRRAESLLEWAQAKARKDDTQVAKTVVGEMTVSTVFLGFDSRLYEDQPLEVFETMIFPTSVRHCTRCATWEEAEAMHAAAVAWAKAQHAGERP